MRRVIPMMSVSVDGFVAGPHGHAAGLRHWPSSTDDYAAPMNEIPDVVFSETLHATPWPQVSIARGDLADEIASLRRQPGGEIIAWGGASFAQRFRGPDSSTNTCS